MHGPRLINHERYDAVLFDMDGVVTDTVGIHAACWKTMFDDYLQDRSKETGTPFRPFELTTDYKSSVDGKPRYDGVRDFLKSRNIVLPEGDPTDPPTAATVCGLGNRKNQLVNDVIASSGVALYPGSIAFIKHVREMEIKTAIVTSNQNCDAILRAAKIEDLFDARVDGDVLVEAGLKGKPAPDSFLKAAELLGVLPERTAVVEDALSGILAGVQGSFGFVIGVVRDGDAEQLKAYGADLVVNDLAELILQ